MATHISRLVKFCWGAGLLALLLLAWSAPLGAMESPGADAEALWKYINQDPGFRKWGAWPEFAKLRRSYSPFGYFVRIYVNNVAQQAKGSPLPEGSIIVREGYGMNTNTYAPTGEIIAYTVMYKVKGFNPKGNDWFWAHFTGTGKVVQSGVVDQCIKCHFSSRDNDYVVDHKLR